MIPHDCRAEKEKGRRRDRGCGRLLKEGILEGYNELITESARHGSMIDRLNWEARWFKVTAIVSKCLTLCRIQIFHLRRPIPHCRLDIKH